MKENESSESEIVEQNFYKNKAYPTNYSEEDIAKRNNNEEDETEEFTTLINNLKDNINEVNSNLTPLILRMKEEKIEMKNVSNTSLK